MSAWARVSRWAARPTVLATTFALMVLFSVLMNAPGLPTSGATFEQLAGGPPFDFRFGGYGAAQFVDTFARAGSQGATIMRAFTGLDVPFPAIYALFWLGLLTRAVGARADALRWLPVLPLLTALADYAENVLLLIAFVTLPAPSTAVIALASAATQLKGALTATLAVAAIVGGLSWAARRAREVSRGG